MGEVDMRATHGHPEAWDGFPRLPPATGGYGKPPYETAFRKCVAL